MAFTSISDVPWESLLPGDSVLIHWREPPHAEKWVICRQGTAAQPIVVSGVPGPGGPWFLKLTGPKATVEAASAAFDSMIRSVREAGSTA